MHPLDVITRDMTKSEILKANYSLIPVRRGLERVKKLRTRRSVKAMLTRAKDILNRLYNPLPYSRRLKRLQEIERRVAREYTGRGVKIPYLSRGFASRMQRARRGRNLAYARIAGTAGGAGIAGTIVRRRKKRG